MPYARRTAKARSTIRAQLTVRRHASTLRAHPDADARRRRRPADPDADPEADRDPDAVPTPAAPPPDRRSTPTPPRPTPTPIVTPTPPTSATPTPPATGTPQPSSTPRGDRNAGPRRAPVRHPARGSGPSADPSAGAVARRMRGRLRDARDAGPGPMARPIGRPVTLTSGLADTVRRGVRLGGAGPRPVGPGSAPRARRHPRPGSRGRGLAAGRPSPHRCLRTERARSSAGRRAGRSGQRLTPRTRPVHTPRTSRTAGCERDEYPSRRRPRDPAVGASRNDDDGGWTREPPDRTRGGVSRGRQ